MNAAPASTTAAVRAPRAGLDAERGPLPGPGGLALVARALALAGLREGARVLDVGCGAGQAVRFMRDALGLEAIGLDRTVLAGRTGSFVQADGRALPIADGAVEAVLLSCVLSAADAPDRILAETARVIVPGGRLLVLDLYEREPDRKGRLASDGVALLAPLGCADAHGFEELVREDHSAVLAGYVARYVLEQGSLADLWQRLAAGCVGPCRLAGDGRPRRLGYCLRVARRRS